MAITIRPATNQRNIAPGLENSRVQLNPAGLEAEARGLGQMAGGLQRLGLAIEQKEEDDDTNRLLRANNEIARRVGVLKNDLVEKRKLGQAEGVTADFAAEAQKIRNEVYAASGIKYKKTQERFELQSERQLIADEELLTRYETGQVQENLNIQVETALAGAVDTGLASGSDDGFGNSLKTGRELIRDTYLNRYGQDFVDLATRKFMTGAVQTAASQKLFGKSRDYAGAKAIIEKYRGEIDRATLFQLEKTIGAYEYEDMVDRAAEEYRKTGKMPGMGGAGTFKPTGEVQREAWSEAQRVGQITGVNPSFIYGQWAYETANFTSRLTKENFNFGGVTQTAPNGEENKQPDGGNYYKVFGSLREYADFYADYIADKGRAGDFKGLKDAKTPEEFARVLRTGSPVGGYFADPNKTVEQDIADYAAGIGLYLREDSAGNNPAMERDVAQRAAQLDERERTRLSGYKADYVRQAFTMRQQNNGALDTRALLDLKYQALANSGFTPESKQYTDLDMTLSETYGQITAAPKDSVPEVYRSLRVAQAKGTLTLEAVDDAYGAGWLSDSNADSLIAAAAQIQVKKDNAETKAYTDRAVREVESLIKDEDKRKDFLAEMAILTQDMPARDKYEYMVESAKKEATAPGVFSRYTPRGIESLNNARALFGNAGESTLASVEMALNAPMIVNGVPVSRRKATEAEVASELNTIASILMKADQAGDTLYREIYQQKVNSRQGISAAALIKLHDDVLAQRSASAETPALYFDSNYTAPLVSTASTGANSDYYSSDYSVGD